MLPCLMPRLLVLAAVLLWLGTATAVAAAPPPRPSGSSVAAAEAGDADGHPGPAKTVVETVADTITTRECPWIELNGTLCRKPCQLRLCQALADFYKASNNITDPWDNEYGWEKTSTMSCEQLIKGSNRQAEYCSWWGVRCCTPQGMADGRCSAVNTIVALELQINNVNCSLQNPLVLPSFKILHGCGMRVLNLEANNIIGYLSEDFGELNKLIVFNFGNSWLSGTIPDSLSNLRSVTVINLSTNWLNGTLPSWLPELTELRVLNLGSNAGGNEAGNGTDEEMVGLVGQIPAGLEKLTNLRELNLEANSLTGELPKDLCSRGNSSLLLLNVRGNKLEGNPQGVEECGNLVQLDISQNRFSGRLPASTDWDELATYRADGNRFSGKFPMDLTTARILEHLDISDNMLTGHLPAQLVLLSSLKTFVVSSNRFSGTVNENIYYLPALAKLDISNNSFVGTMVPAIGLAYGLSELDYSNNPGLTGMLPPQVGLLTRLRQIRMVNTNMSCAGITTPYTITTNNSCSDPVRCTTVQEYGDNKTRHHRCTSEQLLPCFLRFSEYMVPRDDDSNQRCNYIIRRQPADALALCSAGGNNSLGEQAVQLPDLGPDRLEQMWHIDPSYFQFQVCECLLGYRGVWEDNGTTLKCYPAGHQAPTAIIVGVVAAAAVLIIGLLALWQYLTTRPRWLRQRILQAKRSRGAPKASKPGDKVTVSIVVTDVKDFSDLTRQYPEAMNKAMGVHNNILRKASHNHAGYIMDQEGDSWTVAFHDAEDAVAFSLQVQQALAQRSWGKIRVGDQHELSDLTGMRDGFFATRFSATQQSSINSGGVRSGSFGLMGEESYSTAGQMGPAGIGLGSFTAGQQVDSVHSKINTSFTSSAGRASSGERLASFTMPRTAPSEDALPPPSGTGPPAANGPSKGAIPAGSGAAGAGGGDTRIQGFVPDQRQVSFSEAVQGHEQQASPFAQRVQHPQQQQLLRLLQYHEEQQVQPSGNSGSSWPDDAAALTPANVVMKGSFDGYNQPGPEGRLASLSITAASRGRSSGSGSRLWSAGVSVVRRFSMFGRSGLLSGSSHTPVAAPPQHALHLSVRIGIATGRLPYGCDLNTCPVKDRAKTYVSDVANGGQILVDENTFKAIKDSLSVLGTVNDGGYDDRQLQQLLHSRVVHRLQQHMLCGACDCSGCKLGQRDASFSSTIYTRDIQDYDNDALVVHMGAFEPPAAVQQLRRAPRKQLPEGHPGTTSDSSPPSTPSAADDAEGNGRPANGKDVAKGGGGQGEDAGKAAAAANGGAVRKAKPLHLYAVAAPGMRRIPTSTQDITQCLSWGAPVELKRYWSKVQKGYFDAPGARAMDLAPSAQGGEQAALPEVVIVFVQVVGAATFSYKRNRSEAHALKKAVTRCMLQMLDELPETDEGRDGYLCRCQEADLKYMVSFRAAHMALQWCMLVQEALMFFNWPDSILSHPGFEEVLDPITHLPVFRGPRLRMGFAVGQPNSVLPDHTGRANYYGHSVNRAARFMEAAAHGGQIVTDVDTARALFKSWHRECVPYDGAESTPSRAHSDADVQPVLDGRNDMPSDAALLQMLVARSQSETTGHCRPSAARMPLSRLALRQQQQSRWISQAQAVQAMQARESRQQQLMQQSGSALLNSVGGTSKEGSFSSPLPELQLQQPGQQLPPSPRNAYQQRQTRPTALSIEPSPSSFTRRQLMAGSGGSFTRQQQGVLGGGSGGSFTRQQQGPLVGGSGGSFTRQQGSFTRMHLQQPSPAAAAGLGYPAQGTSMSASFSARRSAAAAAAMSAQQQQQRRQQQHAHLVQQSGVSFVMQVLPNWQSILEDGEVVEAVSVTHLGTFSFKGSGVYDMVSILPAALVGRHFPEDAPKGKGYRVMMSEGPVAGIDPVLFGIPPRLVAARQAFLALDAKAGAEGEVADAD